jgi:hypothetical protein
MLLNAMRVLVELPRVEVGRIFEGPAPLVARLRSCGEHRRHRTEEERARLKKVVAWIDGHLPGGGNCYRRSLLEVALDRGAAREPFHLGLRADGGARSGHAWLGTDVDGRRYDAVISL